MAPSVVGIGQCVYQFRGIPRERKYDVSGSVLVTVPLAPPKIRYLLPYTDVALLIFWFIVHNCSFPIVHGVHHGCSINHALLLRGGTTRAHGSTSSIRFVETRLIRISCQLH